MKRKTIFLTCVISFAVMILIPVSSKIIYSRQQTDNIVTASTSDWSPPTQISFTGADSYWSKVAADALGKAYVIWTEEGGGKVINFNTNESGQWGTAENVTAGQVIVREGPWPSINVDKNNNVVVSYTAVTDGNYEIVYNRRVNGVWEGHENVSKTYTGGSVSSSILVDPRGNDYFIIWQDDIDRPSDESSYWQGYVRYKNGSEGTWKGAGMIEDPSARAYSHQACMDDNGTAYVVWVNRKQGGISSVFFSQNSDPKDNSKWTKPIDISGSTGLQWAEPKIACDNNGNVYIVWQDATAGNSEVFFANRVNGQWGKIENLSQTLTTSELPTVAANRTNGEVYTAWQENTPDSWEVYYREYKNGAWQEIQNMSQNRTTSSQPHLFVDILGGIHLTYSDNNSGSWNIYYRNQPGIMPVFPPVDLALSTYLESADPSTKMNVLTWKENEKNKDQNEVSYTIYRKEQGQDDSQYLLIATAPGTTLTYQDKNLPTTKKFWYKMKTLSEFGLESEGSTAPVTEIWMWPPVNLSLQSQMNRYLFYTEKINTLDWEHNPLNDAITLERYDIYRKKTSEDDSAYTLLSSVDAETFEYEDRYLSTTDKYSYRIKAVDFYGVESDVSESVSEN